MDDFEDPDMEQKMREMMGFAAFGGTPDARPDFKKRKTEQQTSFAGTSSNAVPLGQPKPLDETTSKTLAQSKHTLEGLTNRKAADSASPTSENAKAASPTGAPMDVISKLSWEQLEAYRKGVKQENGDIAWFLPSFIVDPWAKLEKTSTYPHAS